MTTLIQGHSVLKSSPIAGLGIKYRYRLTLSASVYSVHVEYREPNGACGESILYVGASLDRANWAFNHYSKN